MFKENYTINLDHRKNPLVPISRFNKGEANKIFKEVKEDGIKYAVKNNNPECVLMSMDKYNELMEELNDMKLLNETKFRLTHGNPKMVSHEEILEEFGLTDEDLDEIEVEIE